MSYVEKRIISEINRLTHVLDNRLECINRSEICKNVEDIAEARKALQSIIDICNSELTLINFATRV
ncbi:MAG: hypothetical protein RRY12_13120 [Cloacibacillus sp.]